MKWKGETNYSRGDKERVPTTIAATYAPLMLAVICPASSFDHHYSSIL